MKLHKRTIRTERLVLKAYEETDLPALTSLLRDPDIAKTFMIPDWPEERQYAELAEKLLRFGRPEDETHLEYGIYLEDQLIGFLNDCGFDDEQIEVGYVIRPECWGRGYATEALRAVIEELWTMGFQRVTAGFFEENTASRRVMEKSGMCLTDEMDEEEYRGVLHRCRYCEIRREPDSAEAPNCR